MVYWLFHVAAVCAMGYSVKFSEGIIRIFFSMHYLLYLFVK